MLPILPVDSGVIRCICDFDHDDNFTIQCERCNAWQHAGCVDIANEASVPDNYLCPECSGKGLPISREEARERQKLILKQRAQLQKASLHRTAVAADDHDEPRRRGRKRRSESEPADTSETEILNAHVYYVPTHHLIWSRVADEWRQVHAAEIKELPVVPRDLKPTPMQVIRRLCRSKRYNLGIDTLALTTNASVPANRFICEVTGEVLTRSEYAEQPHNQYVRLGCPKPGVVFVPGLPLVVDSRRRGSQALFLQRSTHPNVRLVPSRTSKGELRLLLYTRMAVNLGDELTLGWHWPAAHPIRAAPDSPLLQTMFWILGLSQVECQPCAPEDNDEDWEIEETRPALARPQGYAWSLRETFAKKAQFDENEPIHEPDNAPDASSIRVWISPPQEPVVQTKKKLSLADYIKKRA